MILAADYMCNAHVDIVDHHGKVIKRMPIRSQQDQILDLGKRALLWSIDNVVELGSTVLGNTQANREWFTRRRARVRLGARQIAVRIAAQIYAFRGLRPRPIDYALLYILIVALRPGREVPVGFAFG